MKDSYFLQRSKPETQKRQHRGLAWIILLSAVLFAVVMHLPKPKTDTVILGTQPRAVSTVAIPELQTFTVVQKMPYGTTIIDSSSLPAGVTKVTTPGQYGEWTQTYQQSTTNGKTNPKHLVGIVTTKDAVNEVITRGTGPAQ